MWCRRLCFSPDSDEAAVVRFRVQSDHHTVLAEIDRIEEARRRLAEYRRQMSMNTTDQERKVIVDFCHLLEKSKLYFNGLRELPPYGHKQWHSFFGRTFDVYTKLWKYQQQYRHTLDAKYGLQRWQIGEIASKIGQLYYHFYLRTSDTGYLIEAYSFYLAIRGRAYYTQAVKEDRSDLMVKKLRYYARFIVVCLLLRKMSALRDLIKELDSQIMEYGNIYDPFDQREWATVLQEAKKFMIAEGLLVVTSSDNVQRIISHRLEPRTTPQVDRSPNLPLVLSEVVIIGSCVDQTKFSELTVDMYRMIQTLERNPPEEYHQLFDGSPRARGLPLPPAEHSTRSNVDGYRKNPHKFLLFMPTLSNVLTYLSSGCKDLPPFGALLLYISGDGYYGSKSKNLDEAGYSAGGILTAYRRESRLKEANCLYPGDLIPFTRWPLFFIIDSDNSTAFEDLRSYFGYPMVVLMSPVVIPQPFRDIKVHGNLFTLFLHSPLTAFCLCTDIPKLSAQAWERGQSLIDKFLLEAARLITRVPTPAVYVSFMGDEYLRLLVLRYVFCEVVLRMHRAFPSRDHRPSAAPPLPEAELLYAPSLQTIIWDLAYIMDVQYHIIEDESRTGKATKEE